MRYKYTPNLDVEIGRPSVAGRPIIRYDDFQRLGCALFATEARHGRIKNVASDRLYLVLEGTGRFLIEDEDIPVRRGDVVLVPRNTAYDYEGRLKLLLVHSPANLDESDIDLEEPPEANRPPPPDRVL